MTIKQVLSVVYIYPCPSEAVRAEDVRRKPYPFNASTPAEESHNKKRFFSRRLLQNDKNDCHCEGVARRNLIKNQCKTNWLFTPAFTLAEVLITLGIIGVVAAMTIPNLIANTTAHKYRSQFKKTISTLSRAARTSQAQYGFDYAGITQKCSNNAASEHPDSVMSICALFNGTLTGATYYNALSDIPVKRNNTISTYSFDAPSITNSSGNVKTMRAYLLSDGTIVAFPAVLGSKPCSLPIGEVMHDVFASANFEYMADCYGFIDVNGPALPNKEVSCSSGLNTLTSNTCVVKNDAKHMTDIFPIRFHDGIVEPASAAARYVLRTAK